MREVRYLCEADVPALLGLVKTRNERVAANAPYFLQPPGGIALGCVTFSGVVEQALLAFTQGDEMISFCFSGTGGFYEELFNMLCAACSSSTPVIKYHTVVFSPVIKQAVTTAWTKSRLGYYTLDAPMQRDHAGLVVALGGKAGFLVPTSTGFVATVRYPTS